jgi:hypothetical protein
VIIHNIHSAFGNNKYTRRLFDGTHVRRLTCVIALCVIFALRIPDVFLRPQFWAEDGSVFFRDSICLGWKALFKTYAGYYLLIPRLTALFADLFNPAHAPRIYCGVAILLMGIVLYMVLSPRFSVPYKALFALLIIVIPNGEEVYGNITNIQWYLAIGLLVILLQKHSASSFCLTLETMYVFVTGLTGPFALLLLPAFVIATWFNWAILPARRRMIILTSAAFIAAIVQATALASSGINAPGIISARLPAIPELLSLLSSITFVHLGTPFLTGLDRLFPGLFEHYLKISLLTCSVISFVIAAVIFIVSISNRAYRLEKIVFCYATVIILITGYLKSKNILNDLLYFAGASRYFFIPNIMISWFIILCINDKLLKYIATILLTLLLLSSITQFKRAPLIDLNWPFWAAKIGTTTEASIPINPLGFKIDLNCSK